MRHGTVKKALLKLGVVLLGATATLSCSDTDLMPLTVNAGNRSLSKLPFVIAWDQGLFEKHGLKVEMLIPPPEFRGGKPIPTEVDLWTSLKRRVGLEEQEVDIAIMGGTPMMLRAARAPAEPHQIDIGSTDCAVRSHIVGRMGFQAATLEELKGKRLGVSGVTNTLGFQARMLAQRMGWDVNKDVMLREVKVDGFEELQAGSVDAIFVNETAYARAKRQGYPVLFDTADWREEVAGNSIAVSPEWLKQPANREAARRFLAATAEAIAIFHQQPDVAHRVMREWNGVPDEQIAQDIYDRGAWLPRKPYACVAGFQKTIELYQPLTAGLTAEAFYDNSLMRELDESGYLDRLYEPPPQVVGMR